jgi:hypothetical protein
MNQSSHASNGIDSHAELMAGAIRHLRNAMQTGSRRSCAVACLLFTCLAQDETLGTDLCEECKGLGECLEDMAGSSDWRNLP